MSASVSTPLLQSSSPTKSKSMPPPSSPSRPSNTIRSSPSSPTIPSRKAHTSKKRSISEEVEDDEQQQGSPQLGVSNGDPNPQADASDAAMEGKLNGNPNKKRKLTQAEREEREKEKARKEQEKLEKEKEKADKKIALEEKKKALEEAKKKKDEEKRKKDEEKAEAQKKKDEEKRKRDEERAKKERAQTRLSAFFAKPKGEPGSQSLKLQQPTITPDKSIIASDGSTADTSAVFTNVDSKQPSEYERYFQPFFIKQHVTVAPQHAFLRDTEYKEFIKKKLDEILSLNKDPSSNPDHLSERGIVTHIRGISGADMADLLHIPHHKRVPRGKASMYTVKQLLELVNNSEAEINLNSSENTLRKPPSYYLALLNNLPRKHLRFAEDVRPPYSGTFTRLPPANSGLRKGRKPFEKSLPNVDYDYDSEAEWIAPEEEEEGEELLSELGDEEEEEDIEDEEEMEEFLDDDDDAVKRRAGALCPLLPYSTGLCWEDKNGRNEKKELNEMKLGILLEGVAGPIDPFSNHYWLPPPKVPNTTNSASSSVGNTIMSTFLSPTPNTITTSLPHRPAQNTINMVTTSQSSKKLIPAEDMGAFKKAVDGSDMTKAGLVELLKKQFPKASKDAIRETLGKVAVRIGGKEADKRWVLRD